MVNIWQTAYMFYLPKLNGQHSTKPKSHSPRLTHCVSVSLWQSFVCCTNYIQNLHTHEGIQFPCFWVQIKIYTSLENTTAPFLCTSLCAQFWGMPQVQWTINFDENKQVFRHDWLVACHFLSCQFNFCLNSSFVFG